MISREYLNRLVEASPVDLYASGVDGARAYWPWRMNKACSPMGHGARRSHKEMCDHYVLDSYIGDDSVTNQDVLDEAHELGADAAVLSDVWLDVDATVDALIDGLALADDHSYDGTVVLPLQPPHDECYRRVAASVGDRDVWWAVGGVKDETAAVKADAARTLREETGPSSHIHGLGFGVTDDLARFVRRNPDVLDSVDNATSMSNAVSGIAGKKEKMTVAAAHATAKRLEALRAMTPFADARPAAERREPGQTGLEELS